MSNSGFDFSELDRVAADLAASGAHVGRRAELVTRKSIQDVSRRGKQRAPVDTGNLRSSIGWEMTGGMGVRGDVIEGISGPTANYGKFVEDGTSKMAPQPYMGPALADVEPGFLAAIAKLGDDVL